MSSLETKDLPIEINKFPVVCRRRCSTRDIIVCIRKVVYVFVNLVAAGNDNLANAGLVLELVQHVYLRRPARDSISGGVGVALTRS